MISRNYGYRTGTIGAFTYLPMPGRGVGRGQQLIGGQQVTAGGETTFDVANALRTWTLPYTYLTETEYGIVTTFIAAGLVDFTDDGGTSVYHVNVLGMPDETRPLHVAGGYHAGTLQIAEAYK